MNILKYILWHEMDFNKFIIKFFLEKGQNYYFTNFTIQEFFWCFLVVPPEDGFAHTSHYIT